MSVAAGLVGSAPDIASSPPQPRSGVPVMLTTLGCARNEVDSEELAARLELGGFRLVGSDGEQPAIVIVNTCGFVEQAKKDSIDAILEAADSGAAEPGSAAAGAPPLVVAVGCLAERYGAELAANLPEAAAVLGFDSYPDLAVRLRAILDGERPQSHAPRDRRTLLPLSPAERPARVRRDAPGGSHVPAVLGGAPLPPPVVLGGASLASPTVLGRAPRLDPDSDETLPRPASGPRIMRRRLDESPVAPLKIASGCDRRCAFCAIPAFRGSFWSRPVAEVLDEAAWLAERGVRELVLVSENSTSYGKDLGDLRALETLLPQLAGLPGIDRVRVSYLQPAEIRPGLVEVIAGTPGVASYFDLSFQHASPTLLRRMRRFGGKGPFLELLARIRSLDPDAGARSNVIVGFPGETDEEFADLVSFVQEARLDVIGVFGFSSEDGTEAAGLPDQVTPDVIAERMNELSWLVEEMTSQRAAERIGQQVRVLVEQLSPGSSQPGDRQAGDSGWTVEGRAEHQGPEVDGSVSIDWPTSAGPAPQLGELVSCEVVDSAGVDLLAVQRPAR